jgi:hypothetical protein
MCEIHLEPGEHDARARRTQIATRRSRVRRVCAIRLDYIARRAMIAPIAGGIFAD